MSVDIEKLEELAKLATPGPWWIDSHGGAMVSHSDAHNCSLIFKTDNNMGPAVRHESTGNLSHWRNDVDASYIAAANPSVMLELISCLRTAEQERDQLRAQLEARGSAEPVAAKEFDKWAGLEVLHNLPNGSRLYLHPPAPAAAVPDDFLQKLGVWYAKLTNCDAVAGDDGVHVGYCCPIAMMDEFESLLSAAPTPPSAGQSKDREALNYLMDRFDNEIYICCECGHEESTRYMDSAYYLRNYLSKSEQPDSAAPESVNNAVLIKEIIRRVCSHVPSEDGVDHIAIEIPVLRGILNDCIVAQSWAKSHSGAAPQQEPAAWMNSHGEVTINEIQVEYWRIGGYEILPLYFHKPQRITEQDAREIFSSIHDSRRNFSSWAKNEGHTLLAKLNEHREPDYKAQMDEWLNSLSIMTSLVRLKYGNSDADIYNEIEKAEAAIAKASASTDGEKQ